MTHPKRCTVGWTNTTRLDEVRIGLTGEDDEDVSVVMSAIDARVLAMDILCLFAVRAALPVPKIWPLQTLPNSLEALIEEIADRLGVHPEQIRGRDRHPAPSSGRHVFWWVVKQWNGSTLKELGRMLGYDQPYDHTTVMHGFERMAIEFHRKSALAKLALELRGPERPAVRLEIGGG